MTLWSLIVGSNCSSSCRIDEACLCLINQGFLQAPVLPLGSVVSRPQGPLGILTGSVAISSLRSAARLVAETLYNRKKRGFAALRQSVPIQRLQRRTSELGLARHPNSRAPFRYLRDIRASLLEPTLYSRKL
jgi:hypothetical protein